MKMRLACEVLALVLIVGINLASATSDAPTQSDPTITESDPENVTDEGMNTVTVSQSPFVSISYPPVII